MRLAFLLLALCFALETPSNASAHPADMYFQTHYIELSATGVDIEWEIKPGPILANYLWNALDTDLSGAIEPEETDAWGRETAAKLIAKFDGDPLQLEYQAIRFPTDIYAFQVGTDYIVIDSKGNWPRSDGNKHQLELHNQFEEKTSISWFYLSAENNLAFTTPDQQGGKLVVNFFRDKAQATEQGKLLNQWESGSLSLPAGQKKDVVTSTAEEVIPGLKKNTPQDILTNLVREQQFSISFYLFALGISIGLGALHALTPGHGKTVVAAYLVGSRGTTKHAVALGSIVTLTHTGSVFLLGIITLVASRYFLPTKLIPILEVASGLLIVGLGFTLLYTRWKAWRRRIHNTGYHHDGHDHHHEHNHEHGSHTHTQDGHTHRHDIPADLTWRSLIALGVGGGLVPCPDAVAILLVAIAINRIVLGLTLILAFSLGLAIVLILIGLAMVHSSRLLNRMDVFNKLAPALPVVSAAAVVMLGLALIYGAVGKVLGNDSSSQAASVPGSAKEASAGRNQIIFLGLHEDGQRQVMLKDLSNSTTQTLTKASKGVSYFSLSPDHKEILYVPYREDQGSDLWIYEVTNHESRELVNCPGSICSQAVWSPDGSQIVYEKFPLSTEADSLSFSALWWIEVSTGKTMSVFQDTQLPGYNPHWSPDGRWLSYSLPGEGIHIQNLESGEKRIIPTSVAGSVYWAVNSQGFLYNDGYTRGDRFVTRLYYYDLITDQVMSLSNDMNLEDSISSWSPDGKQIAVVRREVGATMGDQIWIMDADGGNPRALTDLPSIIHDGLSWSPDGQFLLAYMYLLDKPLSEPVMIMIDLESDKMTEIGEGLRPTWIN